VSEAAARGAKPLPAPAPSYQAPALNCFPTRTGLLSLVHTGYNTEVMRLFRSWWYARGTSLLAMVILLCLGACLSLLPTELEVSAALTPAHSSPLDQGANGAYLAVPQEEAEDADKDPVNAGLLSELLLVFCFGAIVGWLLANGRGQRAFRFVGLDHRPSIVGALEDRSFLGVFRL
jgi:hypothetical protein